MVKYERRLKFSLSFNSNTFVWNELWQWEVEFWCWELTFHNIYPSFADCKQKKTWHGNRYRKVSFLYNVKSVWMTLWWLSHYYEILLKFPGHVFRLGEQVRIKLMSTYYYSEPLATTELNAKDFSPTLVIFFRPCWMASGEPQKILKGTWVVEVKVPQAKCPTLNWMLADQPSEIMALSVGAKQ